MNEIHDIFYSSSQHPVKILDVDIPIEEYTPIDLSGKNIELEQVDLANHASCQEYIDAVLKKSGGTVAYGGYLERRNLYRKNSAFSNEGVSRNIHLGADFWAEASTKVVTPIDGKIHSFKNNSEHGDYGPTIILKHEINNVIIFTLYGHLSEESLNGLHSGKQFQQGETLATLGSPEINVGYAPHLHFQIIRDIGDYVGDYPGVCAEKDLEFYSKNCPDPNLLLKIKK